MPHEWTADEIRRVGYLVADLIAEHLSSIREQPVFRPVPGEIAAAMLAEPAPEHGVSPDEILREFSDRVEPHPFGNGHPRFWGWVNSPPSVMGVFADALAAAMNPSCAGGNHSAIYVERQVLNWFRDILGFPSTSMGLLVSGGSMATLTALAVARHVKSGVDVRASGLRDAPRPFAFYLSPEAHSCARKAIELLGFGHAAIRTIPTGADYRMKIDALEAALEDDRSRNVQPIAVIATAGTTNTGAIDDLGAIADACGRHDLWMHVDAAYGGPAVLTRKYSGPLHALSRADSVALDPHKWLYVPVEAGLVLVRDAGAMRAAFSLVPPYLRTDGSTTGVGGPPWFSEYGFQQTRGFRALKVWMSMKQFGLDGYKAAIEENLALAGYLADRVRSAPDLGLMAPPSLSVVCFRYLGLGNGGSASLQSGSSAGLQSGSSAGLHHGRSAGLHHGRSAGLQACRDLDEDAIAALNRTLLERLQLGGEAFLTGTELHGRFVLRACIVNYRSRREDIDRMLEAVRAIGRELVAVRLKPDTTET